MFLMTLTNLDIARKGSMERTFATRAMLRRQALVELGGHVIGTPPTHTRLNLIERHATIIAGGYVDQGSQSTRTRKKQNNE
jgi:hypothetical protein